MKAKIDSNGFLWLKRGDRLKEAGCPKNKGFQCGDWCVLFQEPNYSEYDKSVSICLCAIQYCFSDKVYDVEFKDER